jgi:protein SCO1/2/putative membrane protein
VSVLPAVDGALNAVSGVLLCLGFYFIKTGRWRAHATMMISATTVSTAFLVCYLTNHYLHGVHTTVHSHAPHWLRYTYLVILFPHLILAIVMLPMIYLTLLRAYRRDWINHPKIARPTFWIWLYVSVTGVVIYFMLYHTSLRN